MQIMSNGHVQASLEYKVDAGKISTTGKKYPYF